MSKFSRQILQINRQLREHMQAIRGGDGTK